MIDISQWRGSIGLWNYCQAVSSGQAPANGHHSHSFKAALDSKSGSSVALYLIASLYLSLLKYMKLNFIPSTGITVTVMICLQSLVLFIAGSGSYPICYLVLLRLLLSGDIELNPGPVTGNPKDILRTHSSKLVDAVSIDITRTTYALYAKELIPQQTKQEMLVQAVDNYTKAANLMNVIEQNLESSLKPEQYLIDICYVLINQQHRTLTDIATSVLHQLDQSVPDDVSSHTVLPSPVDDMSNTPATNIRGTTTEITAGVVRSVWNAILDKILHQ